VTLCVAGEIHDRRAAAPQNALNGVSVGERPGERGRRSWCGQRAAQRGREVKNIWVSTGTRPDGGSRKRRCEDRFQIAVDPMAVGPYGGQCGGASMVAAPHSRQTSYEG